MHKCFLIVLWAANDLSQWQYRYQNDFLLIILLDDKICWTRAGQQADAGGPGGRGGDGGREACAAPASRKNLKVLYTNAQSVVSKIYELTSNVSDMDPDLILLMESWCNNQITDAFLSLPGYELINELRKDRYDTDRGRSDGLLVYAKNDLTISALQTNKTEDFQCCKFKVSDIIMYFIYRSPSSGLNSFSGMLDLLREAEKKLCNCWKFQHTGDRLGQRHGKGTCQGAAWGGPGQAAWAPEWSEY
jgi:hypothetical protein